MLLKILDDLHTEIKGNEFIDIIPDNSKDIVLCLCGDIGSVKKKNTLVPLLEDFCYHYKHVLYVFGNHEYYDGSLTRSKDKLLQSFKEIPSNLTILDRNDIVIDDIHFIGATLWTNLLNNDPVFAFNVEDKMIDFHKIRHGTSQNPYARKYKAYDWYNKHLKDYDFIKKTVENSTHSKKVVLTHHHLISYYINRGPYAGDYLNPAYGSNYEEWVIDSGITAILCGHTHFSIDEDFFGTRYVCNPKGYANFGQYFNKDFKPNLIIEI